MALAKCGLPVQRPAGPQWDPADHLVDPPAAARLAKLEAAPGLYFELWAPLGDILSRVRGLPVRLAAGGTVMAGEALRNQHDVMGFAHLSGQVKGLLRKASKLQIRALTRWVTLGRRISALDSS